MTFKKMGVGSLRPIIERTYRESEPLQFLRELVTNSLEADSTKVEVGPEHQIGEAQGIWRLMVRDNGRGMSPEQMESYLGTFGKGGKSIGGAHENFGIGAKTSLLPWNRSGMVVISYTEENQEGSMIKLRLDEESGEYGLESLQNGLNVCPPFMDSGMDWTSLKADWMTTGTIVVLMGNTGYESTYFEVCDTIDRPAQPHSSIWWALQYLAQRYWVIDEGVELSVYVFGKKPNAQDRGPASGGKRYIKGGKANAEAQSSNFGCVVLPDQTKAWWYLKDKVSKNYLGGFKGGCVAALYKNELYDIKTHGNAMRRFGLVGPVRAKTLLVFEPPVLEDGFGVCPNAARSGLILKSSGTGSSVGLPWDDWAEWFRERLPDAISQAILEHQSHNDSQFNDDWVDRLMTDFGPRWKRPVNYASTRGDAEAGDAEKEKKRDNSSSSTQSETSSESNPGSSDPQLTILGIEGKKRRASKTLSNGDLPAHHWVEEDWASETGCAGALAATYALPSKAFPSGKVFINWEHQLFVEVYQYWCYQYPPHAHVQTGIQQAIQVVYAKHITSTIAHGHKFSKELKADGLMSDVSLTCSLMGLYPQEDEIQRILTKHYMKPERSSA